MKNIVDFWKRFSILLPLFLQIITWFIFAFLYSNFSRVSVSEVSLYQDSAAIESIFDLFDDFSKTISDKSSVSRGEVSSSKLTLSEAYFDNMKDVSVDVNLNNEKINKVTINGLTLEMSDYFPLDKKIRIFTRIPISSDDCKALGNDICPSLKGVSEYKSYWEIPIDKVKCISKDECLLVLRPYKGPASNSYLYLFGDYLKTLKLVNSYYEDKNSILVSIKRKSFSSSTHSPVIRSGELSFTRALYFSGITLLTIGYGDMSPLDQVARMLVILEGFLGVLLLALLTGGILNKLKID